MAKVKVGIDSTLFRRQMKKGAKTQYSIRGPLFFLILVTAQECTDILIIIYTP